jgi:hypothetical protein
LSNTKPIRLLSHTLGFTFGLALMSATPLVAQGNCQLLFDALTKVATTPTHIYVTANDPSAGGKPRTYETIYSYGSVYMKVKGNWTHSPVTPQQVVKQEQENWQNGKLTCRNLRDESVGGEEAAVYGMHDETSDPDQKFDGQVWISKSKGLPLRREQDIEGGNDAGKSHQSVRYEYGNVQPPL